MRKVVFVFLLFTILSFSVVRVDGMTTKLPPPPDGVSNFVVGYMPNLDTYRLGSTDYSGAIHISDNNGTLVNSDGEKIYFGDRYELINGSWVHYTESAYWVTWADDVGSIDSEEGKIIVFSSNDFYGTQGQLLASAASDDVLRNGVTLIGNQLSSSKLLLYIFSPFRQILPYIVTAIVFIIAFYKAWRWLRGQTQGI
jgi:hypothetical protein